MNVAVRMQPYGASLGRYQSFLSLSGPIAKVKEQNIWRAGDREYCCFDMLSFAANSNYLIDLILLCLLLRLTDKAGLAQIVFRLEKLRILPVEAIPELVGRPIATSYDLIDMDVNTICLDLADAAVGFVVLAIVSGKEVTAPILDAEPQLGSYLGIIDVDSTLCVLLGHFLLCNKCIEGKSAARSAT